MGKGERLARRLEMTQLPTWKLRSILARRERLFPFRIDRCFAYAELLRRRQGK